MPRITGVPREGWGGKGGGWCWMPRGKEGALKRHNRRPGPGARGASRNSLIIDPLVLDPLFIDPLVIDPFVIDPFVIDPRRAGVAEGPEAGAGGANTRPLQPSPPQLLPAPGEVEGPEAGAGGQGPAQGKPAVVPAAVRPPPGHDDAA